jgi:hypothetical protein
VRVAADFFTHAIKHTVGKAGGLCRGQIAGYLDCFIDRHRGRNVGPGQHLGYGQAEDGAVDRTKAPEIPILQGGGQQGINLGQTAERMIEEFPGKRSQFFLGEGRRGILRHGNENATHLATIKLLHGMDAGLAAVFFGHGAWRAVNARTSGV